MLFIKNNRKQNEGHLQHQLSLGLSLPIPAPKKMNKSAIKPKATPQSAFTVYSSTPRILSRSNILADKNIEEQDSSLMNIKRIHIAGNTGENIYFLNDKKSATIPKGTRKITKRQEIAAIYGRGTINNALSFDKASGQLSALK